MTDLSYYTFIFLGTVIFCAGLVTVLKNPFRNLALFSAKQLDIIVSRSLGEREKDKAILGNLAGLLKWLLVCAMILSFLILISILPVII